MLSAAQPRPISSSPSRSLPTGAYNYDSPLRTSSSSAAAAGGLQLPDRGVSVLSCSPAKKQPLPQRGRPKSVAFVDADAAAADASDGGSDGGSDSDSEAEEVGNCTAPRPVHAHSKGSSNGGGQPRATVAGSQRRGGKAPGTGNGKSPHGAADHEEDDWWPVDAAAAARRARKDKKARLAAPPWQVVAAQALLLVTLAGVGLLFAGAFGGPGVEHWLAQQYLGPNLYPHTAAELRALAVSPAAPPPPRVNNHDEPMAGGGQRSAAAAAHDFFEHVGSSGSGSGSSSSSGSGGRWWKREGWTHCRAAGH